MGFGETDRESSGCLEPITNPSIDQLIHETELTDWTKAPRMEQLVTSVMETSLFRSRPIYKPLLSSVFDVLARKRLFRGIRILSNAKVVITDRLHGHILSLLLGIPHVLLDNRIGKNRAFYETWTRDSAITRWANSPAEAWAVAETLGT